MKKQDIENLENEIKKLFYSKDFLEESQNLLNKYSLDSLGFVYENNESSYTKGYAYKINDKRITKYKFKNIGKKGDPLRIILKIADEHYLPGMDIREFNPNKNTKNRFLIYDFIDRSGKIKLAFIRIGEDEKKVLDKF